MSKKIKKDHCIFCYLHLEKCICTIPPVVLRKKRYELGLSRNQLAEKMNVWPSTISRMEGGEVSIGELTARRLAPIFKMHWTDLYWSVGKQMHCPKCGACVKNLLKD